VSDRRVAGVVCCCEYVGYRLCEDWPPFSSCCERRNELGQKATRLEDGECRPNTPPRFWPAVLLPLARCQWSPSSPSFSVLRRRCLRHPSYHLSSLLNTSPSSTLVCRRREHLLHRTSSSTASRPMQQPPYSAATSTLNTTIGLPQQRSVLPA
jgi:hypothetical protein